MFIWTNVHLELYGLVIKWYVGHLVIALTYNKKT
jgi:hypothetical protein